jgi:hypothetical protein
MNLTSTCYLLLIAFVNMSGFKTMAKHKAGLVWLVTVWFVRSTR